MIFACQADDQKDCETGHYKLFTFTIFFIKIRLQTHILKVINFVFNEIDKLQEYKT
jgi:hypothetical protein